MKKPNKLQTIVSVASCKLTRALLRRTGRGGTAIPGIVALKLSKNVLSVPARGMKIIVVTGTNGKTTTCNMIAHAITSAGYPCLLNKSGANLLHGIASDLLCSTDWQGRPKYPYAVLECDEAALKQVVPLIHPGVIVVTNLFSDQVDRYGGVENTLKEIRTGVELSPKSTLVLNAEDPLSSSLALDTPNKVIRFGLEQSVGVQGNIDLSDAGTCPRCGSAYEYDYHVYAHLGGFRCPKCGLKRRTPDVAVTSIDEKDAAGTTVHMRTVAGSPDSRRIRIALPAVYNIYNAAAAVAASIAVNIPLEDACGSLSTVKSSFGRLETFDLNGIRLQMILVKNPAGCNQAFSYVTGLNEDYTAVLCLNNRTGDGHDISWIASTDYEKLCADPHLKKIYVAGDCAQALSERLKEAGAVSEDEERMEVITDYDEIVSRLKSDGRTAFLLPNYTSMMELRQALSKETGSRDFWE
ncbi:MAG: DUF1727 domain-containing protein [Lachnospiraceae bacterium]|nr:DUF1727 domain-containing protein [Lachnospiraceae bacterium]